VITSFNHKFVPEVVRNPKMHYWQVPRLGSYMAIPMVYNSCLSVSSFTQAVDDFNDFSRKTKKQEDEKQAFEDAQEASKIEKIGAGEPFTPEVREWDEITLPSIVTEQRSFVMCLDTMGQDRQFSKEQKAFALKAVFRFRQHWETFEREKLIADRDALVAEKDQDNEQFTEEVVLAWKEKEDGQVDAIINPPVVEGEEKEDEEGEEPIDLEQRALDITNLKLKF
jgi:hypothetical protein